MKRWVVILLWVAVLFSGCTAEQKTTGEQLGSVPTVEDIFTAPVTTAPIVPNATEPMGTTQPTKPNQGTEVGTAGFGFGVNNWIPDEYGDHLLYEDGEMCVQLKLNATGRMAISFTQEGIGIMLFLDGQPQPYRVSETGELDYCHVLYPTFDFKTDNYYFDVFFTPVTGKKGETVEFYATTILTPNWQSTDPMTGWRHTYGTLQICGRIKMNTKPSDTEKPAVTERIHSVEIAHKDATYMEVGSWSEEQLITKIKYAWYIDGKHPQLGNGFMYEWTDRDSVELQFVIWGTPYVRYGLMFYIDNQPISAQQAILFDMEPGKKSVITVNINLSDFDGECVIYAALIPRNYTTTEIRTDAYLYLSKAYYLLDDPEPVT